MTAGTFLTAAGCLGGRDDCYRWGLSFEETVIEPTADDQWSVEGVLRALFSPSSSIEKPYDTEYTDVQVLVLSEGRIVDRASFGRVAAADGRESESDCIDTIVRSLFSLVVDRPPTRITTDCAELPDLCEHGDTIREYVFEGEDPAAIDEHVFGESPWKDWNNRARPCSERELSTALSNEASRSIG